MAIGAFLGWGVIGGHWAHWATWCFLGLAVAGIVTLIVLKVKDVE